MKDSVISVKDGDGGGGGGGFSCSGMVDNRSERGFIQCLWVGKMEGLALWWTCTMKVLFFSGEATASVVVTVKMKERRV